MKNKNQSDLSLLWEGKDRNIFESLIFALFLFLFSFSLATVPDALVPGAKVVVGTANGIGRGYERIIRRLDRNVMVLPEIVYAAEKRVNQWQANNSRVIRSVVNVYTTPSTKLVRWQDKNIHLYRSSFPGQKVAALAL